MHSLQLWKLFPLLILKIQYLFLSTKILPILFVIFSGLHYADIINIQAPHLLWEGIPVALPLILFCFLGFEANCSLSRVIDQPEKNIPKAIIISFCIVLSFIFLYQTIFYMSMGSILGTAKSYLEIFPLLLGKVIPNQAEFLAPLISTTIGIAALGGAYGILYTNPWNLYTLAEQNAIPKATFFKQLNKYSIPYVCVIAEGILCCSYILWLKGSQIPLQYTATLSGIVTYTISVLGLMKIEPSFLEKALPYSWAKNRQKEKEKRKLHDFTSYEIANHFLQKETGTLLLHLEKTNKLDVPICLFDPIGIRHEIQADEVAFILQKKTDLFLPYFEKYKENSSTLFPFFDALAKLLKKRAALSIRDSDISLEYNMGVFENEPILFDIGNLTKNPHPSSMHKEMKEDAKLILNWLEIHSPKTATFFKEKLKEYAN